MAENPEMKYSPLGRTRLSVPLLGFGGIPIQRATRDGAVAALRRYMEKGTAFIDTARGYSDSEEKIGAAIAGVPREDYILACKTMARTGADMIRDIDLSLKTLGVDYIDLYQCHNVRYDTDEEVLFASGGGFDALVDARKAGKIGHIGITGHQVERMTRLIGTGMFETVQIPYNFNEDKPERRLLPLAEEKNVGVIAMKPLGGGALPQDLAMRFFLDKPVHVAIAGMESPEMVDQNFRSVTKGGLLTPAEIAETHEISRELEQSYCRRCDYCQPCAQGVDISKIFIIYNYFTRYNMRDFALSQYGALKVGGDACVKCGRCAERCPYNLPIPEMIEKYVAEITAGN